MVIKEGTLYFMKDEFLDTYGEKYNLMDNKEKKGTKRPTYLIKKHNYYGLFLCLNNMKNTEKFMKKRRKI